MRSVRIGNGCGFWGDNVDAPVLLAEQGDLDYLTLEYLAELTMSILALQKQKHTDRGYAHDFIKVLDRLVPTLIDQPNLKIVTNAGGMNPNSCAAAAYDVLSRAGQGGRKIAVVEGDDLMPEIDSILASGEAMAHMDTGQPLSTIRDRLVSANAYLGAGPIVEALQMGASIIITGRIADAALTLAPAMHELSWSGNDWHRMAAGVVAGHLIECGAQVTGGLWINWGTDTDLGSVGYPIATVTEDGSMEITKPEGSGGAVNRETVVEQLLYEVGDPSAYLTPDVVADFSTVAIRELGTDRVSVSEAQGKPATDYYKVSCAYRDGYMSSGQLVIFGPDAADKLKQCSAMIYDRLKRAGAEPEHYHTEAIGMGACAPVSQTGAKPWELVMRVAVRDPRREVVERFTRELAPLITSGPPGIAGYATGRPIVREVFAYWPALIRKDLVKPQARLFQGGRS